MAVTTQYYRSLLGDLLLGSFDLTTDAVKVALLTSSYSYDLDAHSVFSNVNGFEINGGSYVAGGVQLSNVATAQPSSGTGLILNADPVSWTSLTATVHYAVIYHGTGANNTSRLIGLIDFGEDRVYSAEPLQLSFPDGVVALTKP